MQAATPRPNACGSPSTCSASRPSGLGTCSGASGFLTAAGTFTADATDGHQFVDQGIAADRYRVLIDVIPDLQLRTEAFRYDHHQGTWGWATGSSCLKRTSTPT